MRLYGQISYHRLGRYLASEYKSSVRRKKRAQKDGLLLEADKRFAEALVYKYLIANLKDDVI